jgi:mono/diheme cytochrome c family protein
MRRTNMMKRVFTLAAIIFFLGSALLWAKGEESSEYAQGKRLYEEKCQMCHGANGEGNGPMSSAFPKLPADFTRPEFWRDNPDQRIINAVENGYKLMPRIDLDPNQTNKVIDYVTNAFKR